MQHVLRTVLRTQKLYPLSLWSYPICDPFAYPDIQQNKQPQEMKSMARKAVLDKCSFSCSCKSQGLTSLKTHKLQCGHNLHSSKCLQNNDCWTIGITQKKQSASVSILGNLMAGLEKLIWAQFFFFEIAIDQNNKLVRAKWGIFWLKWKVFVTYSRWNKIINKIS